jgi:hypothetical protein
MSKRVLMQSFRRKLRSANAFAGGFVYEAFKKRSVLLGKPGTFVGPPKRYGDTGYSPSSGGWSCTYRAFTSPYSYSYSYSYSGQTSE